MKRIWGRRGIAALVGVAATAVAAQLAYAEPATTVRNIELKQQPASDASSVLSVPANTLVELVKREGAWVQLRFGTAQGWAKLFDVRLGTSTTSTTTPAKPSGSGSSIGQMLGLATGTRAPTVTTGVRGLDEESSANAPARAPAEPVPAQAPAAAPTPASPSTPAGGRVLDADTLSKAVPSAQEMTVLDGYAATKEQAQAFAKQGRLETRNVEPLKADAGSHIASKGATK